MRSNIEDVEVIYQAQTEKAFCVRKHERDKDDIWIPKAQAEIEPAEPGTELYRGAAAVLSAPEPLLIEKGLV